MCMFPITLKRVAQTMDMTNRGTIMQNVPCGKCVECVKAKQNAWLFRLDKELEISSNPLFVTLTYATENLKYGDGGATLDKRDVQLFMKRLRKAHSKRFSSKLKYYFVGEYGKHRNRPHYHAILLNLGDNKLIDQCWTDGFVSYSPLRSNSGIKYVFKYMDKRSSKVVGRQCEFALMSKGMGANYLTDAMRAYHLPESEVEARTFVVTKQGFRMSIPKYYKDKLFNECERKILTDFLSGRVERIQAEQIAKHSYKYPKKTVNEVLNSLEISRSIKTFDTVYKEVL